MAAKQKPYLTIISSNVSGNRLGRALALADCLKDKYEVIIIGMLRKGGQIWRTAGSQQSVKLIPIRYYPLPFYLVSIYRTLKSIRGDMVIAVKPLMSSFGIGLLSRLLFKKRLILDIDDDEIAFLSEGKNFRQKYLNFNPDKFLFTSFLLRWTAKADAVIVSNAELQKRFGGRVIPHARDPQALTPPVGKAELKRRLQIDPNKFVCAHIGSYRPHKGLERVVEALNLYKGDDIVFLYTADRDCLPFGKYTKRIDEFPFKELPQVLGACDLMLFPLENNLISRGQLPAKLMDALLAGIPFLISELPTVLPYVPEKDYLLPLDCGADVVLKRILRIKNNLEIYVNKSDYIKANAVNILGLDKVSSDLTEIIENC